MLLNLKLLSLSGLRFRTMLICISIKLSPIVSLFGTGHFQQIMKTQFGDKLKWIKHEVFFIQPR